MTIVSLFSGAGGLDLGIIKAGHQVIWANDVDADAVATYRANIGGHIVHADIQNVKMSEIPSADAVIGGFPCQGFSVANRRRHIDDERNALYKFFYCVIRDKQPMFFIAENVKGILNLGGGGVARQIRADFESAGYVVDIHLVDMADYGVPLHRERVFFVGQRRDIADRSIFTFPSPTHSKGGLGGLEKWVSIREAIEDLPPIGDTRYDPNNYGSRYKVVERNFTAHRKTNPSNPSPTILARGNGRGGVCAIPHYNGERRLSIRESAEVQTFPKSFVFKGSMGSCYRQVGNAVPVRFAEILGQELQRVENELRNESSITI